jgi:stage V sporulation protein R
MDYYFDLFLQNEIKVKIPEYVSEVDRYNQCVQAYGDGADEQFHADTLLKYPEFEAYFEKFRRTKTRHKQDLLQYLISHSEFLNREENRWMQSVMQVVRQTSLFFQPQIRTKIMNEGWASYWHETLFMNDDRIQGHEVEYARVNSGVTSMPRVGLNPYALGMRLLYYIETLADKGRLSYQFQKLRDINQRKAYHQGNGNGHKFIFRVRETFSDFMLINTFLDQDFMDQNNLFVAGRRLDQQRRVWQYYVRSRKAEDYRQMLFNSLYHPPHITIDKTKTGEGQLYLVHHFEEKPLVKEYIANTMLGIEYLWGHTVRLETSEVVQAPPATATPGSRQEDRPPPEITWRRVVYTMKGRKLTQKPL